MLVTSLPSLLLLLLPLVVSIIFNVGFYVNTPKKAVTEQICGNFNGTHTIKLKSSTATTPRKKSTCKSPIQQLDGNCTECTQNCQIDSIQLIHCSRKKRLNWTPYYEPNISCYCHGLTVKNNNQSLLFDWLHFVFYPLSYLVSLVLCLFLYLSLIFFVCAALCNIVFAFNVNLNVCVCGFFVLPILRFCSSVSIYFRVAMRWYSLLYFNRSFFHYDQTMDPFRLTWR